MKSKLIEWTIFLIIWIVGCAIADNVFMLGADAWRMFWGFAVGMIGTELAESIANRLTLNRRTN